MKMNLVSDKVGRITSIENLLDASEIDKEDREVLKAKINCWNVATKNNSTSEVELTELFQVCAELRLKHELLGMDSKQVLFDVFQSVIPTIEAPKHYDGQLLGQIIHTDLHIDRLEHAKKNYLKEIDDRTMRLFEKLLKHKPDALIYANLGDYFNTDTNNKTTKGTDQQNYLSERESFRLGLEHQLALIKTLSSELPIEAIFIPGNHDRTKLQALSDAVDLYFSKSAIKVDASSLNRKYRQWGTTTLGYAHGDGIKNKQIPLTMQQEAKMGKYNYFYKGHLHHTLVEQLGNVQIQQLGSPAHPSEREKNLGHVGRSKIEGQLFDSKYGKYGEFNV